MIEILGLSFQSLFGGVCNVLILGAGAFSLGFLIYSYVRAGRGGEVPPGLARMTRYLIDALPSLGLIGTIGAIMLALGQADDVTIMALKGNFSVALATTFIANAIWIVCSLVEHVLFVEPMPIGRVKLP